MITQTYNLNLVPSENQVIVNASQYDEGSRRIEFVLYHGRDLFDINDYEQKNNVICNVRVLGTKADSTGYMYDCGFSHSKVFFDIQEQMTVLAGQHTAEIRIVDNEDNIIGSSNFIFQIEKAALKDDTVISETDIPLLQRILNNIDSINAVETMLDGGTTGQVLAKKSDADGDVEWKDVAGGNAEWGSIRGTLSDQADLKQALDNKVNVVEGKGLSTNDYTTEEKNKLAGLSNYDDTEIRGLINQKADSDDVPTKVSQLQNDSGFINKDVNNLTNYTLSIGVGTNIDLFIDSNYVMTLTLKNAQGTTLSTSTIDLPLESVVVNGRYDDTTKKIILTLENGNEIEFSVADLVGGLQTEITAQNKLNSDLVDDTDQTNKFVSATDISNWNNKVSDVKINNVSVVSGGVASLTIDNTLSNSSENAVQNKVVKGALDNKQDEITSSNKLNSDLITDTNQNNKFVSAQEKQDWNSKSDFSGNYNDLTNKPTIPTNVSQLNNDSGYLTLGTLPIYNGGIQ